MNIWFYKGLGFPDKKSLRQHFNLSTCKFNGKVKDNEIIKLTNQQASANETTQLHNNLG